MPTTPTRQPTRAPRHRLDPDTTTTALTERLLVHATTEGATWNHPERPTLRYALETSGEWMLLDAGAIAGHGQMAPEAAAAYLAAAHATDGRRLAAWAMVRHLGAQPTASGA